MKWLLALALVSFPGVASAYLDPGTGSLIIQSAIAAAVGLGLTARIYWYRLKNFFGGGISGAKHERENNRQDER